MTEGKLRAAVIGAGVGGGHGYAYTRAPEYEFVAVCDINPEVLARFYERAEIERGSVAEYEDYRAMLERERLDVVSVATPDHLHVGPVCDAVAAGVRGIFCEKPLATTAEDADRIIDALARHNAVLSVDHTRSWLPSYQAVRTAIRSGEIGSLTRIVAHLGGRRAMLFRNGTHLVDAVCFFADAEPVWVIAAHERGFENYGPVYDGRGGKDPQFDPGSTIIVEFANGVRGLINCAKRTPQMFELDLQGTDGRFWMTDQQCMAWKTDAPEGTPEAVSPPPGRGYASPFGANLIPAVQELAQAIQGEALSSSPAVRGRHVLEIMVAALRSQAEGSAKVELPLPRG